MISRQSPARPTRPIGFDLPRRRRSGNKSVAFENYLNSVFKLIVNDWLLISSVVANCIGKQHNAESIRNIILLNGFLRVGDAFSIALVK